MSCSNRLDVEIFHSVEEVGQETWDHLSAKRPCASYRWYRFGERISTNVKPIYIVLSRKGEPLARATFWLKRQEPLPTSSKIVCYLTEVLLRRWPLLLCRTPWRSGASGLVFPDPPLRDVALTTIVQAAWDQARQHRASFLVFDYLTRSEMKSNSWSETFILTTTPGPGTRLNITRPDFESYLKDLSKSMWKDYRRHCNRAADLGIQVKRHPTVTSLDEAMVLIRNVERRHQSAPDPWARLVLENAHMLDATWLTAEIEGRLVGCGLLLGDRDSRLVTLLGLDYDVRYAYFQLIYEAIRCAIDEEVRLLRGGSGAYEIKQRLGFQLEHNNYTAFKPNNRILGWVGRRLSAT